MHKFRVLKVLNLTRPSLSLDKTKSLKSRFSTMLLQKEIGFAFYIDGFCSETCVSRPACSVSALFSLLPLLVFFAAYLFIYKLWNFLGFTDLFLLVYLICANPLLAEKTDSFIIPKCHLFITCLLLNGPAMLINSQYVLFRTRSKFKSVFNANKIVKLQMVKTLRPPGPWLSCYSCLWSPAPPSAAKATQGTFFPGLELAWQVSLISLDTVVSCLKSILRTLRILDAVPEHPLCGAVLGLHVTCPPPALRSACSLHPHQGSQHLVMLHCLHHLWAHHDFVTFPWSKKCLMKDWRTVQRLLKVYFWKKGN